jgi:WD40 repeat protein
MRLWDTVTGQEIAPPYCHRAGVWSVAFSPDGQRLATGCWFKEGGVRTWKVAER